MVNAVQQADYDNHKNPLHTFKRASVYERVMLWLFLTPFALDFKGDVGKGGVQMVFLAICLVAAICLFLQGIKKHKSSLTSMIFLMFVYILSTFVTVLVSCLMAEDPVTFANFVRIPDQVLFLGHYARLIAPFVLCGLSVVVVYYMKGRNIDPRELVLPLFVGAIISSIWRYEYSLHVRSDNIQEIRFQIISPATTFLFAYCWNGIFLSEKIRTSALIAGMTAVSTMILSVTRSFILTGGICFIATWYIMRISRRPDAFRFMVRKLMAVCVFGLTLGATFFVATLVRPDIGERWMLRMMHHSSGNNATKDNTYLMRNAETFGMWNELVKTPASMFFGKGIGADYYWDIHYSPEIDKNSGFPTTSQWSAADVTWPYVLFSSGIILGGLFVYVMGSSLIKSFKQIKGFYIKPSIPELKDLSGLTFVTMISYASQTITGNPFADRYSGLIVGIFIGLSCWFYDYSKFRLAA